MSLLNPDRTSEANVKAIAKIPSHIVISLISLIFCGLTGIGGILCGGTTGIIAIVYAVLTFTAKKNLDYEVAMRYSQIAKIWAIAAYIAGVFCLFALLID